jgi:GNAT superfamily N-acetyltransferase
LLAFYDYPAGHWVHLRTTNQVESTFATVRHRTTVTKGPGSRAAGLAMAFKLIEAAEVRLARCERPSSRRPRARGGPLRARDLHRAARNHRGMTPGTHIVDAFPARRGDDAALLVFEYLAATLAEAGRPAPASAAGLPAVLGRELHDLQAAYRPPGALLLAYHDDQPAGCVGLARHATGTAEVRRLYVRPAHRGKGIARALMSHAHHHAAQHQVTRLILDVLPTRTSVIAFYRRLGYTDTEPYATESPVPMIYMQRLTTPTMTTEVIHRS